MNILMTGGTGFIGAALCRHWLRAGHRLTVLSRSRERVRQRCGPQVRAIAHFSELASSEKFDAVINLAGEGIADRRWSHHRKYLLRKSRITLTQHLLNCLERLQEPPPLLISGSAVGYYGDQGSRLLDEQSGAVNDFAHQLCRDWEQHALRAEQFGVRVCLLRLGVVLGPDGGMLKKLLPLFRLGLGGRLGTGEQWLSWIHLDDVVGAIDFVLHHDVLSGVFNVCAPRPVTNEQFTESLAQVLHRPARVAVPAWALRLAAGEMAGLLLGGQRALPTRIQCAGYNFQYSDIDTALAAIAGR